MAFIGVNLNITSPALPNSRCAYRFSYSPCDHRCPVDVARAAHPTVPRWIARATKSGRGGSNKNKGKNNPRNANSNKGGSKRPLPSSIPEQELELTELFEEDIESDRLSPSFSSSSSSSSIEERLQALKDAEKEQERKRERRKQEKYEREKPSVIEALQQALPKSRDDAIELLVKGAWYGVGTLVLLFFAVHLFIVGDWVGRGN